MDTTKFLKQCILYHVITNFTLLGPGYVQSTHISNDAFFAGFSGGVITLKYGLDAGGKLVTGQTDTIRIDTSLSFTSPTNNLVWLSIVSNENGYSYTNVGILSGQVIDVDVFFPVITIATGSRVTGFVTPNTNVMIRLYRSGVFLNSFR